MRGLGLVSPAGRLLDWSMVGADKWKIAELTGEIQAITDHERIDFKIDEINVYLTFATAWFVEEGTNLE